MEMSEESIMHHSGTYSCASICDCDRRVAHRPSAKNPVSSKARVAAMATAACLAVACLAAPGLGTAQHAWADAVSSDAAITDVTAEPAIFTLDPEARAAAAADGSAAEGSTQTLDVAGVHVTVPANLELTELDGVTVARNGSESLVVSVSLSTMDNEAAADEAHMAADFTSIAQTVANELEATLADFGATTLTGGTNAYLYELEYTQNGVARTAGLCFVPTDGTSFALVQIAVDGADQDMLTQAREVADSIVYAGAETAGTETAGASATADVTSEIAEPGATDISTVLTTEVASVISAEESAHTAHSGAATDSATNAIAVGGITFELPTDFTSCDSTSADEYSWVSSDGSVTVGVIPALIEDVSGIGTSAIGLVAEGIIEGVGGTTASHTVLTNENTDVEVYVFTFTSSSVDFAGVLGIVVLPDNSVTALLSLTPAAAAAQHDPMITEILQSVRVE